MTLVRIRFGAFDKRKPIVVDLDKEQASLEFLGGEAKTPNIKTWQRLSFEEGKPRVWWSIWRKRTPVRLNKIKKESNDD